MTVVPLAKKFLPLVVSGLKTSTIRKGVRPWSIGPALITSQGAEIRVCITDVRFTTAASLTEADALEDGFQSLSQLKRALHEFYPDLSPSDDVTIVSFRRV